jgi:site-specific recombinase XerD
MFIEFICQHTDVEQLEEITRGMVNSHFRSWYKKKVWDSATDNDLRVALRKFFQFLATEKGITNQKAMDALK